MRQEKRPFDWRMVVTAAALLCAVPAIVHACPDIGDAPTTRWQITRVEGVAWLVDPCGGKMVSIGVNVVDGGNLEPQPLARGGYDWRKFARSLDGWAADTRTRLLGWGFNSAGGWSLAPAALKLPSIPNLELGRMAQFHWFDSFSPETEARVFNEARELTAPYRNSPYRIGYYSDNEVGWWNGALFNFFIQKPGDNWTKRRLVDHLREVYSNEWSRFVADFAPPEGVHSFDALLAAAGQPTRLRPASGGFRVVRSWTAIVASRYYDLMRRALKAADPNALYFGDRLPIYYDPVAVRAMAPHVDAIAVNYNLDAPDGWVSPYFFDGLRALAPGVPILISEWFFAAKENRSGNTNNGHLMTVATQAERAKGAAAAAARFAADPDLVGFHWFQYYDYPGGGRPDGEDYNFGLIDTSDRPYEDVTAALAAVNRQATERRRTLRTPASTHSAPTRDLPRAAIDTSDGHLGEWPKDRALLAGITPAPGEVPFGDYYAAWSDRGIALAAIGMDYYDIRLLGFEGAFPSSEAFRIDIGIDAGGGPRHFVIQVTPTNAALSFTAAICRREGDACLPVGGAELANFNADQPRITLELLLPWNSLGLESVPSVSQPIRLALATTAFYRSRWMSWGEAEPNHLLRNPTLWRSLTLAP